MDALRNTQLNDSKGGLSKAIGRSVVGAVGAAAMIYLVICALQERAPAENAMTGSFATRMGEHRCEKLPDESQVCLNTNTKIRYAINRHTRTVELVSGEASFTVKSKDPRSFDVLSGGLLVHDLSTSFDVYRKIQTTLVTVIDGQVTVVAPLSPASLSEFRHVEPVSAWKAAPKFHRLQQVEFDETTGTLSARNSLTEDGLAQLLAWQRGRIDLNGRTLRDALTEFARYQPVDRFNIPERSLRDFRVGGELDATSLKDFLDTLEFLHHIHHSVATTADGKVSITLSRQRIGVPHSNSK